VILLPLNVRRANPSAVIPLPEYDDMPLGDLKRSGVADEPPEGPDIFAERVRYVFPKSPTARLAKAAEVDVRLAQRWMSGRNQVPPPVEAFITEQIKLMGQVSVATMLHAMVEELKAKGIHIEAIAAQIAAEYEALIGREIE
jgi:hypothetical protein